MSRRLWIGLVCLGLISAVALMRERLGYAAQQPAKPAEPETSGFIMNPYLQYVTRTSVVIMCETPTPTQCVISYGPKVPGTLTAKSAASATIHEIKLDNLEPKSRYFYRVTCTDGAGKEIVSKDLSFYTAPDPDDAWSFAVIGDTQRNPTVTGQVGDKIWKRRPNFVIHCGDVVDNGPVKNEWVHDLFGPCKELFGRVPLFPCIGNHEKNHANYYTYFSLPKPEYYYSFKYANADFFSIDTNKKVGPGSEQYEWLDKALTASRATWKFCFHHHPPYSSDNDDYGNTFQTTPTGEGDLNARSLVALYEKHNVDVVFCGHIHVYERTWPIRAGKVDRQRGVQYIISGGGGGKLEDFSPTPAFFKAEFRSDFHYCYLTLHKGELHFKAFDKDDRLFDQFSIIKPLKGGRP